MEEILGKIDQEKVKQVPTSGLLNQKPGGQFVFHRRPVAPINRSPSSPTTSKPIVIPEHEQYTCDRVGQNDFFKEKNETRNRLNFFYLHGNEAESHRGLVKRYFYQLLGNEGKSRRKGVLVEITPEESAREDIFKRGVMKSVFTAFELDPDEFAPLTQQNLRRLCEESPRLRPLGEQDVVVMMFLIESDNWQDYTPAVLKWFIQHFCQSAGLPPQAPHFYFFLSVVYKDEKPPSLPKWQVWKKPPLTIRERFLQAVRDEREILLIPELEIVDIRHVDKWLGHHHQLHETVEERKTFLQERFKGAKQVHMDHIEKEFRKIIKDFNNRAQ
jgi:hypothetical protein